MEDEALLRELLAGHVVGERRFHEPAVVEVAGRMRVALHGDRGGEVVGKVNDVEEMIAPVAELAGAVIPRGAPLQVDQSRPMGRIGGGAEPEGPVDVGWRRGGILQAAVPEVALRSFRRTADPDM